jgi:hypothetical protein
MVQACLLYGGRLVSRQNDALHVDEHVGVEEQSGIDPVQPVAIHPRTSSLAGTPWGWLGFTK